MKKGLVVAAAAVIVLAAAGVGQNFTYVGSKKCQICHKTEKQGRQYPIWEAGLHSKAFQSLTTQTAVEAAKAMGIENPSENPKCLKCHAPLAEKAPEFKAEGVNCEVCHGPGSEYKKLSVMKDREKSVNSGLVLHGSPEAIKAYCLKCHENSHGSSFDFTARWDKIKHDIPGK